MNDQAPYLKSLDKSGDLPTTQTEVLADLIDNMDGLPGSAIHFRGEDIWLSTSGQVEGWLRDFLEAYEGLTK